MSPRTFGVMALLCVCMALPALAQETVTFENNWGPPGIDLTSQSAQGVEINFSVPSVGFLPVEVNREILTRVSIPGTLLGNDAGAPDLPSFSRYIAVPQGAQVLVELLDFKKQVFEDMDIVPAAPIPLETEDGPPVYVKNPAVYSVDALYPAQPVMQSDPFQMRGVDCFILAISPVAYNPVKKELTVYSDMKIEVSFQGGTNQFGQDAYRNRYWEPILAQHLLNYSSLPAVNFHNRGATRADECEYMIFAPNDAALLEGAETIKDFRVKQGISTIIYNIASIGGTAGAIENTINNAYNNWKVTKPVAVLLIGDNPAMPAKTWDSYCLSDNIYADVTGNGLPELNVARMTARNATEMTRLISKFKSYEMNPPTTPGYYENPIMAGGWQTERWFVLCTEVVFGFLANVEGKTPVREYAIYSGSPTTWSTATNTNTVVNYFGPNGLGYIPSTPAHLTDWGGNTARINADINAGAFYMLHRDHGYELGWGEPDYDINSLSGLNNQDLCFVLSINCLTGKYDYSPQCFAEAFHRMNNGALGIIAASHISYSFVNDTFIWGMHDSMWPHFDPGYGGSTGENVLMPGFAQASGKIFLAGSSWPYNSGSKEVTYHLFHMHGDAFTTMGTEMPQNLTVAHDSTIATTAGSFSVTANAGSLIGLSLNGKVLGTADGTGAPVTINITPPAETGTMYVTVTEPNYRRYEGAVDVIVDGPLAIWCPDGTPTSVLPGPSSDVTVRIANGLENYVPGSGLVHYRFNSADPYATAALTSLGGELYNATVPGARPGDTPEFYFSAQGDMGSTAYCPDTAPASTFTMSMEGLLETLFFDDCETDMGWTVQNIALSDGPWGRGIPVGGGDRQDPPTAVGGSGRCYLTDNVDGNSDVDGGPTILTSPTINLASGDAQISYYVWHGNDDGDSADNLKVEISNNNGASWSLVESLGSQSWTQSSFMVTDFLTPTAQMKVRFSAKDNPNDSVDEGGMDSFLVQRVNYNPTLWSDAYELSVSAASEANFMLDAGPGYGNNPYLLLGSTSGTNPGIPLGGGVILPLNWDSLTNLIIAYLGTPFLTDFYAGLDSQGQSVATFDTMGPLDPGMVGLEINFAYFLTGAVTYASNPVTVTMDL